RSHLDRGCAASAFLPRGPARLEFLRAESECNLRDFHFQRRPFWEGVLPPSDRSSRFGDVESHSGVPAVWCLPPVLHGLQAFYEQPGLPDRLECFAFAGSGRANGGLESWPWALVLIAHHAIPGLATCDALCDL